MNFRLTLSAFALASLFAAVQGCAVQSDGAGTEADAEKAATSESELHQYAQRLLGAYHGDFANQSPSFEGLAFKYDGTFFADIDSGIRCVRAPCPSHARVEGRFYATRNYVYLRETAPHAGGSISGWYRYDLNPGHKLSLERLGPTGRNWQQSLSPEHSYCKAQTDCENQGLATPRCAVAPGAGWSCNPDRTCSFSCTAPTIWPTSATQLIAENAGGGFTAPPPPGSTCAVGAAKYTLDAATKVVLWERCEMNQGAPAILETVRGQQFLTDAEYDQVIAAVQAVKVSTRNMCGADKPFMTLAVTDGPEQKLYTDSFYSCFGEGPFVDNIDGVFGAFRQVVR